MEQIRLKANINECTVENWQSNAGEFNARVMSVEMSEELCSCDKQFVTFELEDGTVYESRVVDGKAELPFIERPQFVKIGLYAEDTQGDKCEKRFSSKPAYEYINIGSYTDNVSDNVKPTPGDYAELLEKIEDLNGSGGGSSGDGSGVKIVDLDPKAEFKDNEIYNANTNNLVLNELHRLILEKQDANLVQKVDENSLDGAYPSAKAVYEYVNEVIGGIENGSY